MRTLTAKEVKQRIDRVPVFDVRGDDEFNKEHIPGAKTAPLGALETRIHDVMDDDSELIVHCTNQDCDLSQKAANRLETLGHTNVYRFEGGLDAWKREGYDTVTN